MNGKHTTLLLLVLITLIVGISGFIFRSPENQNNRYYLKNSGGAVLFEHQKHADMIGNCADCHHAMLKSESLPCSECHDADFNKSDFTHADMKDIEAHTCTTCHPVDELAKSQNCRNCHSTPYEDNRDAILCKECHDETYDKTLMTHDELVEVEGHSCDGCHYSQAIGNIYHNQCSKCHILVNEKKFTSEDGKIRCQQCHLK